MVIPAQVRQYYVYLIHDRKQPDHISIIREINTYHRFVLCFDKDQ